MGTGVFLWIMEYCDNTFERYGIQSTASQMAFNRPLSGVLRSRS